MRLIQYLRMNGLTLAAFGAQIGRSTPTVSRIARGVNRPDWDTLNAIQRATNGAVTPNDFIDMTRPRGAKAT